jgi:hypothetical protein
MRAPLMLSARAIITWRFDSARLAAQKRIDDHSLTFCEGGDLCTRVDYLTNTLVANDEWV